MFGGRPLLSPSMVMMVAASWVVQDFDSSQPSQFCKMIMMLSVSLLICNDDRDYLSDSHDMVFYRM